jgi:hypothetical protein
MRASGPDTETTAEMVSPGPKTGALTDPTPGSRSPAL